MIVCLWSPEWALEPEVGAGLLEIVPRVCVDARGVIWADLRGLDAQASVRALLERLDGIGVGGAARACAGVATVPIVAEVAARDAVFREDVTRVQYVRAGEEREFLSPLRIEYLNPDERMLALLIGVGVETCGALAQLEREAVEVRFGADAVRVWKHARADDQRRLFTAIPPQQPHATLDFIDYVVTDPERLIFTANSLLSTVCDSLARSGEHARRITLTLSLANKQTWTRVLKPARPTANRTTWLRLIRGVLEKLSVPDAVSGIGLSVDDTEQATAVQGDLFDAGFASASAVEAAVARVIESEGEVLVTPAPSAHPLIDRRVSEVTAVTESIARTSDVSHERVLRARLPQGALTLQLNKRSERVLVETINRRDHVIPIRYRDSHGWVQLVTTAGPDRVSGERWGDAFAREYFRAVTIDGRLVWLYHEPREDSWFLQGEWD